MKYKGKELKEITTPQVFDPPKQMFVWEDVADCKAPYVRTVSAVIRTINGTTQVVGDCSLRWQHCAEIPEEPKPRRATNRELAKWLAQGKGEWGISKCGVIDKAEIGWFYDTGYENQTLQSVLRVRKWDDAEWHEPTVDYMGIEDKQVNTKTIARYDVTDKYGNQYSVRFTENGLKVFPTPVSIEKSEEIISLACKQFPELANGNTTTFDHNATSECIDGERKIVEADLWNRACSDENYFKETEVKIGNQVWMNKNLDVSDGGEGIFYNEENDEYYYTWDAAKRIADKILGWHLPSRKEWYKLVKTTGYDSTNLRAKSWNGTDKYGFSAVPAGLWYNGFSTVGSYAYFWTSEPDGSNAWDRYIGTGTSVYEGSNSQYLGFSVRLVKDK